MGSKQSDSLRAIVYVSKAAIEFDAKELERLLTGVRDLNRRSGVTGVLLFSNGNFMQYFEGPESAVADTWQRITASMRHTGLIALFNDTIGHRMFADWQMGFAEPTATEMLELTNFEWKKMRSRAGAMIPRPDGLVFLEQFWKLSVRTNAE